MYPEDNSEIILIHFSDYDVPLKVIKDANHI